MNVLLITGDKSFGPGHERFELQKLAADRLEALYWGRGALWPALPAGPFDVVSAQDPLVRGLFAWHAAKRKGARFNVQVHMDLDALPLWKHVLAQIVLRHAGSVRVVSEKIKRQVERIGTRAQVSVLPVYIDIERFTQVMRAPHNTKTILWIGRFEEEKDPLRALEVLKEVRASVAGARLVMLGKGSLESALRERAIGLPVEFAGWQDPAKYLGEADAVLSTSWHESFGASIIEALAAGVPVVSPDVGVAREAGATVAAREDLARETARIVNNGERGELKFDLPDKDEWITRWKESLS